MNFLLKLFIALPIGWTVISIIRVIVASWHQFQLESQCRAPYEAISKQPLNGSLERLAQVGDALRAAELQCTGIGEEAFAAGISAAWNGWYQGMIPLLLILIAMHLYTTRKQQSTREVLEMSLLDQIRETGLFDENDPQDNGTISFPMRGRPDGATIYVPVNDREIHIRHSAVAHFRNAQTLQEFIDRLGPSDCWTRRPSDPYYVIVGQHLPAVLAIIRP